MTTQTMQTYAKIAPTFLATQYNYSDRLQKEVARFLTFLPPNALVLDVGCGPGYDAATFAQRGHRAVATDLSLAMMRVGHAEFDGPFVQSDMRQLPFAQAFDGLWVAASLLHLPKQDGYAALDQFARLLKKDGTLFLMLKEGVGEEVTTESYGYRLGRYFCYWESAELDAALSSRFEIVDGWLNVFPSSPQGWLIRYARKK